MLATQEAQVIPVTQMKHFCTLIWLPEVACDPVPLLTPALLDGKSERSESPESPELAGRDCSRPWMLFGSVEKEEQSGSAMLKGRSVVGQYP